MKIDKYNLTHKSKPLFIAEAAVEHLGSLEVAKRMVDAAKYAGADIIKFQMHLPEEEMLKDKIKFIYQISSLRFFIIILVLDPLLTFN